MSLLKQARICVMQAARITPTQKQMRRMRNAHRVAESPSRVKGAQPSCGKRRDDITIKSTLAHLGKLAYIPQARHTMMPTTVRLW